MLYLGAACVHVCVRAALAVFYLMLTYRCLRRPQADFIANFLARNRLSVWRYMCKFMYVLGPPCFTNPQTLIHRSLRRPQADSIADFLARNRLSAKSYHAGKPLEERERVQAGFLSGAVRVVVATVAFGMGVDKQRLGGVVHACLPRSLEEYVQQVSCTGLAFDRRIVHVCLRSCSYSVERCC